MECEPLRGRMMAINGSMPEPKSPSLQTQAPLGVRTTRVVLARSLASKSSKARTSFGRSRNVAFISPTPAGTALGGYRTDCAPYKARLEWLLRALGHRYPRPRRRLSVAAPPGIAFNRDGKAADCRTYRGRPVGRRACRDRRSEDGLWCPRSGPPPCSGRHGQANRTARPSIPRRAIAD